MRYIWIWMLLGIDIIWLISSIVDVMRTVKYVREHRVYGSVGDFINCMVQEVEKSTIGFVALHILALFMASFMAWIIRIRE